VIVLIRSSADREVRSREKFQKKSCE